MIQELNRLRVRLTAWYVGVFGVVLLGFGAALFYVLTLQISSRLDDSLADAAVELSRATLIREREGPPIPGHADALDELRIPDRTLYLFDREGELVHPDTASSWIRSLAKKARPGEPLLEELDVPGGVTLRALARTFALPSGNRYVAVATADVVELNEEFAGLLLALTLAAVVALTLVGLGGWFMARSSTEPVRDAFQRMRDFTADAAHELRTPVAVVAGHAEVALRQPRNATEYVEILEAIHSEANRLGGILENLLTMARADAGAWPVHMESFYLDDLLVDVLENAGGLTASQGVSLKMTELDELPVRGDRDLLRQLLMIILDNAVKFSPAGATVRVAGRLKDGRVSITVEDDGPGMDEEVQAHAFERFYRGDSAHRRGSGAGLGLSIARWIADVHRATVVIHSRKGEGTRVSVSFPVGEE